MDSVYVFKYVPSSVKRLIYLYLIGLGTPTSQLIKEEYEKLFEKNKHNIIVTRHMSMYEAKDVGFMGLHKVMKVYSKKSTDGDYPKDLFKKCYNDITASDDLLLPEQIYEINTAKLFYIYNCTNTAKFEIIWSIVGDTRALEKLFKYKYLQLKSEENFEI
jgi:hypothetical protein